MLSKAMLDTIGLILRIGRKLRALPVDWNPKLQQVSIPTSKRFFVFWYLTIVYIATNSGFMSIRLGQAACCMNMSYGKLFMNLFTVITWITGTCTLINTWIHLEDMVQFINQFFKTNQYFERIRGSTQVGSTGSSVRKITYGIYMYSVAQFFIALRQIDKNPKYFFTLTGIEVRSRWKVIPLALFECYMSFHIASVLLFYVVFFLAYVKSTSACLDVATKQDISTVPKHYIMLQNVNNRYTAATRSIIMPFMLLTVGSINILSNYASIRLYHDVSMPGFLGFPLSILASSLIIIDTIPASYQIYKRSKILIHTTQQSYKPDHYTSKFLVSCKPLSIRVSGYFIIKQVTLMTYLGIVIDNAIMMLLSF